MADSLLKRELLFVAGALQPLCKLLIDPKAADQVNRGINALKNMLRIAMWAEVSVALSAMGKPLVQVLSLLALLVYEYKTTPLALCKQLVQARLHTLDAEGLIH
jgi:hypothetical protein